MVLFSTLHFSCLQFGLLLFFYCLSCVPGWLIMFPSLLIQPNKHRTVSLFTLSFLVEPGRMSHIFHESVEQSLLSMISFYILRTQQTFLLVRCIMDLFSVKVRNLLRSYDPFVGVCVCVRRKGKNSYTDLDSCFRLLRVFRVNDEMTE